MSVIFWELSDAVLSRIEGANYADNKSSHNEFLKRNPYVAKRKFINMHWAPSFRFLVYCFSLLELVGTFLLNKFFFIIVVFGYICYVFVLEFLIIPLYWYFVFGSVLYNCCRVLLLRLMKLFLISRVWNLINNFCVWYLVNTEIIAYCFWYNFEFSRKEYVH